MTFAGSPLARQVLGDATAAERPATKSARST
jgi:hypothetical protein